MTLVEVSLGVDVEVDEHAPFTELRDAVAEELGIDPDHIAAARQ